MKRSLLSFLFVVFLSACDKSEEAPDPFIARKVLITEILVKSIPLTNSNGGGWDGSLSGPDIYFRISDDLSNEYFKTQTLDDVSESSFPIKVSPNFSVTDFEKNYSLQLWDYDPIPPDQAIGGYYFQASKLFSKDAIRLEDYPTKVINETGPVKWEITLIWSK